jgi:hypothetical protein
MGTPARHSAPDAPLPSRVRSSAVTPLWAAFTRSRRARRTVGGVAVLGLYVAAHGWLFLFQARARSAHTVGVTVVTAVAIAATVAAVAGVLPVAARIARRRAVRGSELARLVAGYAPHRRSGPRRLLGVGLTVVGLGALAAEQGLGNALATDVRASYLPVPARVGLALGAVLVTAVVPLAGAPLLSYSRPRSAHDAIRALLADDRAPVLYLRSFADDRASSVVEPRTGWASRTDPGDTREVRLVRELRSVGPVIAVSPPDEELPVLGAARFHVRPDEWQQAVGRLMGLSRLVVIRLGESDGLWWEFAHAVRHLHPGRILVLVPAGHSLDVLEARVDSVLPQPSHLQAVASPSRHPWVVATLVLDDLGRPSVVPVGPLGEERGPLPPSASLVHALDTSLSRIGIEVERPTRVRLSLRRFLRSTTRLLAWLAVVFLLVHVGLALFWPAL